MDCQETRKVYEFFGWYWTCLPFRDVTTMCGDALAERYEHMLSRLEQITRVGYHVEFQWECEFDDGILASHPELKTPCSTTHSSDHSRRHVRESEAMRLHYTIQDGENVGYVDVMRLSVHL
jgi:hypothetical protein